MQNFIKFSIKHPVSVLMILLTFIICSFIALNLIQIDYLPKFQDRFLLISAEYNGIPAEQMKKLVTKQLEDSAASIKGLKNITSVTRDGLSLIQVELRWNTDPEFALTETRQIIDQCYEILPTGCSKPNVKIFNPYSNESAKIVIIPKDGNLEYARYLTKNSFKPSIQRLNGIASVTLSGGETSEVQIIVDKIKAESLGLQLSSIAQIIRYSNFEYPSGNIQEGNKEFIFKTDGLIKNIEEISDIPVSAEEDKLIKLSDFATVQYGKEERETFFTFNGNECISLSIIKKSDTSPLTVSKELKSLLSELNEMYGSDFEFKLISDLSTQLIDSIKQLILSLLIGSLITVIILVIFFRKLIIAFLVASIMPLSILSAILVLTIFNRSLNIISISGIAIGIGMVIDASIVLIENFYSKIKLLNNENYETIVYESTKEVSLSSVGSALTTIIVFIPFFFLSGLTGKLFLDLAIAVITSISFSCILSLSYIPSVLILLCKHQCNFSNKIISLKIIENKYHSFLQKILHNIKIIPIILITILLSGFALIKVLKIEMMPKTYSPYITAEIFFDETSTFNSLIENTKYFTSKIADNKNFIWYTVEGGIETDSYNILIDPKQHKERLLINCKVKNIEEAVTFFEAILKSENITYNIYNNKNILEQILDLNVSKNIICSENENDLKNVLKKFNPSNIYPDSIVKEYVFEPNRNICARYNISASQGAQTAFEILEGCDAGIFYKDGKKINIKVKYPDATFTNKQQVLQTMVSTNESSIPLGLLGNLVYKDNEKIFYRYNRCEAKISEDTNLLNFINTKEIINPNQETINELIKNSCLLIIIVILLLYCIMGAQFESFTIPVLMMFALPPAFTGAFLFLLIFNQTININSIIALVVLFGTSVNNSIIIYENIKDEKIINIDNVCNASTQKFRSILITTLTSICALIPFSIDPLHKNAQSSMSIAIIGGLLFSFIIVLITVPAILYKNLKKKNE